MPPCTLTMWSCASLSRASVVMPGTTCAVSMSSTSEARRPAVRMPAISAGGVLRVLALRELSHRKVECRVFTGMARLRALIAGPGRPEPRSAMLHAHPHAHSNTASPVMFFEGGNALSAFRAQALLPQLQAVCPRITGVVARHGHWVLGEPGAALDGDKLAGLLRYGDAHAGGDEGALVVVMPRLGTVSPWASKATDIARNCGLALHRVERVTEYRLLLKTGLVSGLLASVTGSAAKPLTEAELQACAALLHDRMTER